MSDERRTDARVTLPLDVRWEGQSGKHKARTTDLSLGGCYIISLGDVTLGEMINFEVQLPTQDWLMLRGEVIYRHPNVGFGVRFLPLPESKQKLLSSVFKFGREV